MINQVIHGDCFEVLKNIPDNYFDSLITDPPAGISFMGRDWDGSKGGMLNWINWFSEVMNECLRTMKPGACGLVWSIPRTSHWTGMALELAGFRLIDCVHHCFGSGFPKGQNVSRQIDIINGTESKIIKVIPGSGTPGGGRMRKCNLIDTGDGKTADGRDLNKIIQYIEKTRQGIPVTEPSTPEAKQWDGWKTPALKPAIEGWWLVQKPISESSIARNILKHGVGGINIEACRIPINDTSGRAVCPSAFQERKSGENTGYFTGIGGNKIEANGNLYNLLGRYPANLILSCGTDCQGDNHSPDCPVSVIGEQSGIREVSGLAKTGTVGICQKQDMFGVGNRTGATHNDQGTAARYFKQLPFDPETVNSVYYQTKASTKDRTSNGTVENTHPTVKSTSLMEYFIKLITPPGGIVLDPFGGSGTTAVAAKKTGFNYVLIEKEQEYINIINKRLNNDIEKIVTIEDKYNKEDIEPEYKQMSLF